MEIDKSHFGVIPSSPFPPLENATDDGLIAIGGDITNEELLIHAYRRGIFPWPIKENYPITWFAPKKRGVLLFKDVHISKSLKKFKKKCNFKIVFNKNFDEVIERCATIPRKGTFGSWITKDMMKAYHALNDLGLSYSVEVYQDTLLVGGLYGVCIGNYVSGESMFHTVTNASKVALLFLIDHLKKHQIEWLDIQMVSPTLKSFGGKELPRDSFIKLLNMSLSQNAPSTLFTNEVELDKG